jgi:hypothetical protein
MLRGGGAQIWDREILFVEDSRVIFEKRDHIGRAFTRAPVKDTIDRWYFMIGVCI